MRGRTEDLAREHVTIAAPGATGVARVLPQCDRDGAGTAAFLAAVHVPEAQPTLVALRTEPTRVAGTRTPPLLTGAVRGEATPELPLPQPDRGPDGLPPILAIVLPALLPASLIGIAAAVLHRVRTP